MPKKTYYDFDEAIEHIKELEGALRNLLRYTDDEFAGDGMPDSPEQAAARAMLATSEDRDG